MFLTFTQLFKKPSAKTLAQQSLEDSQRQLLVHEANTTFHSKMAEYHRENIRRLTRVVAGENHG